MSRCGALKPAENSALRVNNTPASIKATWVVLAVLAAVMAAVGGAGFAKNWAPAAKYILVAGAGVNALVVLVQYGIQGCKQRQANKALGVDEGNMGGGMGTIHDNMAGA